MKAHEYLSQGDNWCQDSFCQDANGAPMLSGSAEACKRCMVEAINHCYSDDDEALTAQKKVYDTLYKRNCTDVLTVWNDKPGRTKEEVIELLKEADV